jgi:hypothetical protein
MIFMVAFFFWPLSAARAADGDIVILGVAPFFSKVHEVSDLQADSIADGFTSYLAGSESIALVERQRILEIGKEIRIGRSGLVDPSTAARVGLLAGCQYMLLGSVTEYHSVKEGTSIRLPSFPPIGFNPGSSKATATIHMRVVDAETGEIILSFAEQGNSSEAWSNLRTPWFSHWEREFGGLNARALFDAIRRLAHKIREELGGEFSHVLSAQEKEYVISLGATSGVKEGDLFLVYAEGKDILDMRDNVIGKMKIPLAVLKVLSVDTRHSVCGLAAPSKPIVQRGDKIEPINSAESKKLEKKLPSKRPARRAYDDTADIIWGNGENRPPADFPPAQPPREPEAPEPQAPPAPSTPVSPRLAPPVQPSPPSRPAPQPRQQPAFDPSTETNPAKVVASYGLDPGSANVLRVNHISAASLGNTQKAYDKYVELANTYPDDYLAAYHAGRIARRLRKPEAAEWLDYALRINPGFQPALNERKKIK